MMDRCSVSDGYQSDDKSSDDMNSEKISQHVRKQNAMVK